MSYTYDLASAVAATLRLSKVRLLIGDNDGSANYEMEDDEITYFLTERANNIKAAAADACQSLATKYSKLASFTADGLNVQNGQRAAEYAARAKELRADVVGSMSTVPITRTDGYSEEAGDSEYEKQTVYVRV